MKRLAFALAACAIAFSGAVTAGENYFTVEAGKSKFIPNGLWSDFAPITSYGYASDSKPMSNTWSLGVGHHVPGIGSIELAYHDFGNTTSFAGYPTFDPNDPRLPAGCTYPCGLPTQWVSHYGSANAFSLSLMPEYRLSDNFTVYGRIGIALYQAHFEYKIAHAEGSVVQQQFSGENSWNYTGLSPLYGAGLRYKNLYFEVRQFQTIGARNKDNINGSFTGIRTFTLGYRVTF